MVLITVLRPHTDQNINCLLLSVKTLQIVFSNKRNETKSNETKPNETKPNETKPNETPAISGFELPSRINVFRARVVGEVSSRRLPLHHFFSL